MVIARSAICIPPAHSGVMSVRPCACVRDFGAACATGATPACARPVAAEAAEIRLSAWSAGFVVDPCLLCFRTWRYDCVRG